jgi:hypothetical protein
VLGAGHLQHEHVVRVVVRRQAGGPGWGQVGVGLDGMAEPQLELAAEARRGGPPALESLQDDRGAGPEQVERPAGIDQVVDARGAGAGCLRVIARGQYLTVAHEANRRPAQPRPGEGAVDVGQGQHVVERAGVAPPMGRHAEAVFTEGEDVPDAARQSVVGPGRAQESVWSASLLSAGPSSGSTPSASSAPSA